MADKKQQQLIKIGLLGLGTVGGGVYKTILNNFDVIRTRTGCEVTVSRVLVRDLEKERQLDVDGSLLTLEPEDLIGDASIDIFIEVMGGIEPAKSIILDVLRSGRHVITANKELLAKHGAELLAAAEENGVHLLFEASVAGGIPIIRLLQGYLTANRVDGISGILNGTCNYILTEMAKTGRDYSEILEEAKLLGYAEADPTSDVEGYDAAYKLAILANLAYDVQVETSTIERQGISQLSSADVEAAKRLGYTIKLVGAAAKEQEGVRLSVRPRLLPGDHPLARVDDVFNAVTVQADVVGDLTFIGRGAGELPTASAVVEDLTALLTGGDAIRRPSWHRRLEESASGTESGEPGGLYLSAAFDERECTERAERLEAALFTQGGFVAKSERLPLGDGKILQSWLLGGVSETQVRQEWQKQVQNAPQAPTLLFLPVEGPLEPGVEWIATTGSSYHERNWTLDSQVL